MGTYPLGGANVVPDIKIAPRDILGGSGVVGSVTVDSMFLAFALLFGYNLAHRWVNVCPVV